MTKNRVSAKQKQKTKKQKIQNSKVKNWSKLKLKIGPSMLRNIIGPVFNFKNCVFVVLLVIFINPLLSAGKMRFSKRKTKKMDQFLTLKRQTLDQLLTVQHIYIYMATGTSAAPKNVKNLNFPQFYSKNAKKRCSGFTPPFCAMSPNGLFSGEKC